MRGSKRMLLTERVGRSGREAVVGLSPLLDKTGIAVKADRLCPFCIFGYALRAGRADGRQVLCELVWIASGASICARACGRQRLRDVTECRHPLQRLRGRRYLTSCQTCTCK